jgi:hypothetical protein
MRQDHLTIVTGGDSDNHLMGMTMLTIVRRASDTP